MNPSKKTQLHFSQNKGQVQAYYTYPLKNTKFLGQITGAKLSWAENINSICKNLKTEIYIMKRIKCISNERIAIKVYFALKPTSGTGMVLYKGWGVNQQEI